MGYMLMANYLVAQKLILTQHSRALLRNHQKPELKSLQEAKDTLVKTFGNDFKRHLPPCINLASSKGLGSFLRACQHFFTIEHPEWNFVFDALLPSFIKTMKPAEYLAAGDPRDQSSDFRGSEDWHHYALAIPYYTHFTSPIRRYADVIVHRVLTAILEDEVDQLGLSIFDMEDILEHCNEK